MLRERIRRQEILPGTKLPETALAQEFGVNRARIRQALHALQQRGLVEHKRNRGAVVAKIGAALLFQIYDVFELLEGLCARLATENTSGDDWRELAELFGGPLMNAVEQGDLETYIAGIDRYRNQVQRAADNPIVGEFLASIYDKTQMIIRRAAVLPDHARQAVEEHRAIIAAMQAGDASEAERLKRENMRRTRALLKKYESFVL